MPLITPVCPLNPASSWVSLMRTSMSVVCHSCCNVVGWSSPAPGVWGLYGDGAPPGVMGLYPRGDGVPYGAALVGDGVYPDGLGVATYPDGVPAISQCFIS